MRLFWTGSRIEKAASTISAGIEEVLADPLVDDAVRIAEVHSRCHQPEVPDLLRIERSIKHREGPAHTVAEEVDGLAAGSLSDDVDAVVEIAIDVVLEGERVIQKRRLVPVDHVDVEAVIEERSDHGSIRL